MRKKRKKFGEVDIDLTPLLDVIFVILFIFLQAGLLSQGKLEEETAKSSAQISELQEKVESLEDENSRLFVQAADYQNQVRSYENFQQYARLISIGIIPGYQPSENAQIVLSEYGEEKGKIASNWSSTETARQSLVNKLQEIIDEQPGEPVYIAFTYGGSRVYKRDVDLVIKALEETGRANSRVYYKYVHAEDLQQ